MVWVVFLRPASKGGAGVEGKKDTSPTPLIFRTGAENKGVSATLLCRSDERMEGAENKEVTERKTTQRGSKKASDKRSRYLELSYHSSY